MHKSIVKIKRKKWFHLIFSMQSFLVIAIATEGPLCKLQDQIGAMIIYDGLAFEGRRRAIAQMSRVLV